MQCEIYSRIIWYASLAEIAVDIIYSHKYRKFYNKLIQEAGKDEGPFLSAILKRRCDPLPRRIYADWLDEHERSDEGEIWRNSQVRKKCAKKNCPEPVIADSTSDHCWKHLNARTLHP
jgi:uncharacterized protein (TIGR02996 family)